MNMFIGRSSIPCSFLFISLFVSCFCFLTCKKSEKEIVNIYFDNISHNLEDTIKDVLKCGAEESGEVTLIFKKDMLLSEGEKEKDSNKQECLVFSSKYENSSLPLFVEPFYVLANNKMLSENLSSLIRTDDEFASLLSKSNMKFPILLSASDDETFLFFLFSTMLIADGKTKFIFNDIKHSFMWKDNPVFNKVIEWQAEGFFHPEWLRFTFMDVEAFMENEDVAFVFIKNSDFVKLPTEVQNLYSIINLPSFDKKVSALKFAKVISLFSLKDGNLLNVDKNIFATKKVLDILNKEKGSGELLKKEGLLRMSDLERIDHLCTNNLLVYQVFVKDIDGDMINKMRQYFHVGGFGY